MTKKFKSLLEPKRVEAWRHLKALFLSFFMFSNAYYEVFSRLYSMKDSILLRIELEDSLDLYGNSLSATEKYLAEIFVMHHYGKRFKK